MLNGLDPIIIFNFKKLVTTGFNTPSAIPSADESVSLIDLPVIPIYLSERLTGVYIDTEDKSIDVDTNVEGTADGTESIVNQRPISSSVKINMLARKGSIGVALFSAMAELIFPKVTSKEYSITYLHGAVTVFNGLLKSFSINQQSNTTLYEISMEIIKPPPGKAVIEVKRPSDISGLDPATIGGGIP